MKTDTKTFTKGGKTRIATTPADEVALRYAGWAEQSAPEPDPGETADGDPTVDEPPRNGAGSGRDAWADYAAGLGLDVADNQTRDEIIAAVDNR